MQSSCFNMKNKKASGLDGLPCEFKFFFFLQYTCISSLSFYLFLNVYEKKLNYTQRLTIITVKFESADRENLKN